MKTKNGRLLSFKEVWKKNYSEDLTDAQADEYLNRFVGFFEILIRIDFRLKQWQERLKTEPKGFPITNGIYDCNLCRQSMRNFEGWFDQYGLKCPLCQKAVDEGIVPGSIVLNDETWFSTSQLSELYSWHHTTIKKKVRNGELKARIIKNKDGKDYFYVFLKEENTKLNIIKQ